ncbi:MAG: TIGR03668 family PPOX class F420-dependent oxidoreductase, partial [Actinomycetota bacterium]|nr:TIGR03668 family PPOX class F420-dependent oxidoreductase [Actinomycetota bacterium]
MESLEPELRRLVSDHPVARLATVRPDGHPHLVPVTFALDGERIVTVIDHKPKTTSALQRLKNIEAHPAASVMIDHYEEDWSRLWWVRADGAARIVAEGAAREHAVGRLVDKY